ncbi:MAG: GNAT family N-acetyltransferase, partial [Firmicutes bacterium]|nr:GNAT family N-acetyltransferase [Bacillota bacterium]
RRPPAEIWGGYGRNNRKNIKKAGREGLEVLIEETPRRVAEFKSVYRHTLERNRAGDFYYFDDRFFDYIHNRLQGHFAYAYTCKDGVVVSAELLLFNKTYLHSFLGGTLEQFYYCRPNNILKHEAIKWAKDRGIKYFLLGGGRRDNDGIFRYKRSFAQDGVVDFYVGKKVHDSAAAAMLNGIAAARQPHKTEGFFPAYRRC